VGASYDYLLTLALGRWGTCNLYLGGKAVYPDLARHLSGFV